MNFYTEIFARYLGYVDIFLFRVCIFLLSSKKCTANSMWLCDYFHSLPKVWTNFQNQLNLNKLRKISICKSLSSSEKTISKYMFLEVKIKLELGFYFELKFNFEIAFNLSLNLDPLFKFMFERKFKDTF